MEEDIIGQCDVCDSSLSEYDYEEGSCPDCAEPLESEDIETEEETA